MSAATAATVADRAAETTGTAGLAAGTTETSVAVEAAVTITEEVAVTGEAAAVPEVVVTSVTVMIVGPVVGGTAVMSVKAVTSVIAVIAVRGGGIAATVTSGVVVRAVTSGDAGATVGAMIVGPVVGGSAVTTVTGPGARAGVAAVPHSTRAGSRRNPSCRRRPVSGSGPCAPTTIPETMTAPIPTGTPTPTYRAVSGCKRRSLRRVWPVAGVASR